MILLQLSYTLSLSNSTEFITILVTLILIQPQTYNDTCMLLCTYFLFKIFNEVSHLKQETAV